MDKYKIYIIEEYEVGNKYVGGDYLLQKSDRYMVVTRVSEKYAYIYDRLIDEVTRESFLDSSFRPMEEWKSLKGVSEFVFRSLVSGKLLYDSEDDWFLKGDVCKF